MEPKRMLLLSEICSVELGFNKMSSIIGLHPLADFKTTILFKLCTHNKKRVQINCFETPIYQVGKLLQCRLEWVWGRWFDLICQVWCEKVKVKGYPNCQMGHAQGMPLPVFDPSLWPNSPIPHFHQFDIFLNILTGAKLVSSTKRLEIRVC